MNTKFCKNCEIKKSINEFYKYKKYYQSYCKCCVNKKNKKHQKKRYYNKKGHVNIKIPLHIYNTFQQTDFYKNHLQAGLA